MALLALALPASNAASGSQDYEWATHLDPNHPADLTVRDGGVWLVSETGGVIAYDIADSSFSVIHRRPRELVSNSLVRVLADGGGRLWFGSSASGVSVYDPNLSDWNTISTFEGLPSDTVTAIAAWGDSVWVGTPSGFAVFAGGTLVGRCNVRIPPDVRCPLDSHVIRAIAALGDGAYLGTPAGVAWYDGETSARLGDPWNLGTVADLVVHEGLPWVLTQLGAFQWDPRDSLWISTSGLPNAALRRLATIDGKLYAATSAGIYEWSGASWSLLGSVFNARAVAGSESEGLWAAGFYGLHGLRDGVWTRLPAPGPTYDDMRSVAVGRNEVWFTGAFWVHWFDGESWNRLSALNTDYRLQSCDVHGILVDSSNRLWFGHCCSTGLPDSCLTDRLTRGQDPWRWKRFDTSNIWRVAEGGGAIWLGARYSGLYRIEDGEGEPEHIQAGFGLSSNFVSSVAFDPARGLWIGHRQEGVDLFRGAISGDPSDWSHLGKTDGLPSDEVRKVLPVGNRLWIGTVGGVCLVNQTTMTVIRNYTIGPGGIDDRITGVSGLAADAYGNIWVSTEGRGIFVIRTDDSVLSFKTENSPLTDDQATDIAYDAASDAVWIATLRGINSVTRMASSPDEDEFTLFVYPNPYCPDGCEGFGGGPLRIGGLGGAASGEIVDIRGQLVARFFDAEPGDAIWSGTDVSGNPAGSGLYFVVVGSGSGAHRAKFTVLR